MNLTEEQVRNLTTMTEEERQYLLRVLDQVRTNFLDLEAPVPCILKRIINKL